MSLRDMVERAGIGASRKRNSFRYTFVYLVRQDSRSWSDTLRSLYLLNKGLLSQLEGAFQVVLFTEGPPLGEGAEEKLERLRTELGELLVDKRILLSEYVRRNRNDYVIFPHPSRCDLDVSVGYRDMCLFFAFNVHDDAALDESEYMIRVDTDSFFLDVEPIFLKSLETLVADYAFIEGTVQSEDKAASVGFGRLLYRACQRLTTRPIVSNWKSKCQEATSSPKIYYTNFEVVRVEWARSDVIQEFRQEIVRSDGIYNYRWGDAMIRYYLVAITNAKTESMRGVLYKHSGIYDSRSPSRRLISRAFLKLSGKAHKNDLENGVGWLESCLTGIEECRQ